MDDIYKIIEECNPNKKHKTLIVFDHIITDMLSYKKLNPVVVELFVKERKLNIYLVFIMQSYYNVPKNIKLNFTYNFVKKITKIHELQQTELNQSSDIDFRDFMNFYKKKKCKCTVMYRSRF